MSVIWANAYIVILKVYQIMTKFHGFVMMPTFCQTKMEFNFQNEFPVVSLDFVKVSRVKPSHNAVDLNIFRYVN